MNVSYVRCVSSSIGHTTLTLRSSSVPEQLRRDLGDSAATEVSSETGGISACRRLILQGDV